MRIFPCIGFLLGPIVGAVPAMRSSRCVSILTIDWSWEPSWSVFVIVVVCSGISHRAECAFGAMRVMFKRGNSMLLAGWLETLSHRFSSPLRSLNRGARRRKSARVFRPVAADLLEDRTVLSSVDFALSSGKTPKAALPVSFDPTAQLAQAAATVNLSVGNLSDPSSLIIVSESSGSLNAASRVAFIGIDDTPAATAIPTALTSPNDGASQTLGDLSLSNAALAGKVAIIGLRGTTFNVSTAVSADVTPITRGADVIGVILNNTANRTIDQQVYVDLGVDIASRINTNRTYTAFNVRGTGNKTVVFSNLSLMNGLEVATGDGTDVIGFEDTFVGGFLPTFPDSQPLLEGVGGSLEIASGSEASGTGDVIYFTGQTEIENDLRINTEGGDDDVLFDGGNSFRGTSGTRVMIGEDLLLSAGNGADLVALTNVDIGGESLVSLSNGDDVFNADGAAFADTIQVLGEGQTDTLRFANSSFAGTNADKLLGAAAFAFTGLIASGGTGDDSTVLETTTHSLPALIVGGFGNDTTSIRSSGSPTFLDRFGYNEATENTNGSQFTAPSQVATRLTETRALFRSILVPESAADTSTVLEDPASTTGTVNLLANDTKSIVGESLQGTNLLGAAGLRSQLAQTSPLATVAVAANGAYTFAPTTDKNSANVPGPIIFRYLVDNGLRFANSTSQVAVTVTPVNDAPIGAVTNPAAVLEDAGAVTTAVVLSGVGPGPAPAPDEAGQVVTRTIQANSNPSLFAAGPTLNADGTITFTPAPNQNGSATLTLRLQDDGGTANGGVDTTDLTVTITVTAVNDAPAGTNSTQAILEGQSLSFTAAMFGFTDPNDTPANALARVRISTLPATGTLTLNAVPVVAGDFVTVAQLTANQLVFTPANPDDNGAPYTTFTFQVEDDGGTANGGVNLDQSANTLTINVTDINDEPAGTNSTQAILEGQSLSFTAAMFGFTDPNDTPANALARVRISTLPATGTLTLNAVPVVAGDFVTVAQLTANQLVFTPANPDDNGAPYTTFTFQVEDDGGTANGGVNLDQTANTLTINITAVNDAPVFVLGAADVPVPSPGVDTPVVIAAFATGISRGPTNEAGQTLTFTVTNDDNALFTVQPDIDETTGDLTFTVAAGAVGVANVTVTLTDNGGTSDGGVNFLTLQFTITIS